jgi:hypothetical protein
VSSVHLVAEDIVRISLTAPVGGGNLQTGSFQFEDGGGYIWSPQVVEVDPGGMSLTAWMSQGDVCDADTLWRLVGPIGTVPEVTWPANGRVQE